MWPKGKPMSASQHFPSFIFCKYLSHKYIQQMYKCYMYLFLSHSFHCKYIFAYCPWSLTCIIIPKLDETARYMGLLLAYSFIIFTKISASQLFRYCLAKTVPLPSSSVMKEKSDLIFAIDGCCCALNNFVNINIVGFDRMLNAFRSSEVYSANCKLTPFSIMKWDILVVYFLSAVLFALFSILCQARKTFFILSSMKSITKYNSHLCFSQWNFGNSNGL